MYFIFRKDTQNFSLRVCALFNYFPNPSGQRGSSRPTPPFGTGLIH